MRKRLPRIAPNPPLYGSHLWKHPVYYRKCFKCIQFTFISKKMNKALNYKLKIATIS